jgi:opacity protein-like surface antigen
MKKLILAAVAAASLAGVAAPAANAQPYWGYRHHWGPRYWGPGPYAAYWGPGPYYGPYWRHRYWGYRHCYRCRW